MSTDETGTQETVGARRARGGLASGTVSGLDVRNFLRMLNRRKWHLVSVTAVVVALAFVFLAQTIPEYRSTALVMFDTRKAKVTNTTDVLGGLTADLVAVQTEIEVLRSASLLGRVVDKTALDQDPEFSDPRPTLFSTIVGEIKNFIRPVWDNNRTAPSPNATPNPQRARAIGYLSRNLTIAGRGRSYVIAVSFDAAEPAKARRIVDAITDAYIVDQLNAKFEATKRATEWLDERLGELRRNVEAADRAVADFREKNGLTIVKDSTIVGQSLMELNSQLIQARAQLADRESRLIALQRAQRDPAALGSITEVLNSPVISSLRGQEAEVGRRVADLVQRYGDSHPRLLQARAELSQIQGRLAIEVGKVISSVQGDAEAARAKEHELKTQVHNLERQAGNLAGNGTELRQLEREAQSSRTIYEDFLKRFKELREQQDIQQPDARILSPATVPTSPVYPRYGLTLGLAAAAGLILGAALIGVMERLDGGFRTGEQIERLTGLPTLGMIPSLPKAALAKQSPARFAVMKPSSAYSEALRSALTAIMLGAIDSPPRVMLVSSSMPDEGKTTFAASLAGLLARSNPGKKYILVDCDLRRSSITRALGVPAESADTLDAYLSGAKRLEQVLKRDEESGLYYIAARPNTPNSAEILDSRAMQRFLDLLKETYDLVILDTPPVMAVSDARVIAKAVDYVVFLIRWERTPRELAINALKLMKDLQVGIGVVLSQVDVRRHSRYGYGDYGYYYSRYREYYRS
jgi:exopolysaccharide transport family protein